MYKIADIGSGVHGLLALLNPKLDTIAFCDINEKRLNDAVKIATVLKKAMEKDKEPTPVQAYSDYREMIKKEKPDIVTMFTPTPLHAEMCLFALEHGCHVFVEKPMCMNVEECDQLIDAVKRTGLKLGVNHCARTIQSFQYIYDLKAAGVTGEPYYIRCEYLHGSLKARMENPDDLSVGQCGALFSGGNHAIDLILGLMNDPPSSVLASGNKHMVNDRCQFNDRMNVLIQFPEGRTGYTAAANANYRRGIGMPFEFYGTKSDVCQTFTYQESAEPCGLRIFDQEGGRSVYEFAKNQIEIELGHGQGFYRQIENLLFAVEHDVKQRTMADVVDGARTVYTALAAEKSAVTGEITPVKQLEPLKYCGTAPLWDLDDYQNDMLREYVPVLSNESRKKILGITEWSNKKTNQAHNLHNEKR